MADQINKELSRRVRALRISKGMTVDNLADAIDAKPTYVTRIENGKSVMSAETLIAIAKALGVLTSVVTGELRADDPQPKEQANG